MEKLGVQEYLKKVERALHNVKTLTEAGISADEPVMQEQADKLQEGIAGLVEYLQDEDMSEVAEKIPSIDSLFKDDPVSEFTEAVISHLQQEEANKDDGSEEDVKEEPAKPLTSEDFAKSVVADLEFGESQEEYKGNFTKELAMAVESLQRRSGMAKFIVTVDGETLQGSMSSSGRAITVDIQGKEYVFDNREEERYNDYDEDYDDEEEEEEEEYYECTGDPDTCNVPGCGEGFDDEEYFEKDAAVSIDHEGVHIEDKDGNKLSIKPLTSSSEAIIQELKKETLLGYIKELDEEYYTQVHEILKDIEDVLKDKTTFNSEELDLIRYYFKNQPYNSEDIDSLSDKALTLAWEYRDHRKSK